MAFTERWQHYRGRLHCYMFVLFVAREAGYSGGCLIQ